MKLTIYNEIFEVRLIYIWMTQLLCCETSCLEFQRNDFTDLGSIPNQGKNYVPVFYNKINMVLFSNV